MTNYTQINGYTALSKFKSLKEFNDNFEQIMLSCKHLFTKGEYVALNKLRKFAGSELIGVAWARLQKVVAATHIDALIGVSRRTFDRMLRKAKEIGLITVINQYRRDKRQKHNVYVFNRLEDVQLPSKDVRIVSKSNTIDAPENVKIDAPLTNNLSKLPKEKQVKDINISDASNLDEEAVQGPAEIIETYATNEYQKMMYELIDELPMPEQIKDNASTIALRVGDDATLETFVKAKDVLINLASAMRAGLEVENVVATFTAALNNAKSRQAVPKAKAHTSKPARAFWNWLTDRSDE